MVSYKGNILTIVLGDAQKWDFCCKNCAAALHFVNDVKHSFNVLNARHLSYFMHYLLSIFYLFFIVLAFFLLL